MRRIGILATVAGSSPRQWGGGFPGEATVANTGRHGSVPPGWSTVLGFLGSNSGTDHPVPALVSCSPTT